MFCNPETIQKRQTVSVTMKQCELWGKEVKVNQEEAQVLSVESKGGSHQLCLWSQRSVSRKKDDREGRESPGQATFQVEEEVKIAIQIAH